MDDTKRNELIEELRRQPRPHVISIERFFDGNDDRSSIGRNLSDQPGMEIFESILTALPRRGDVEAVYAQIAQLDRGWRCWPFTDTIFVVGKIDAAELRNLLRPLQPDEVVNGKHFGIPAFITERHDEPVLGAWWG
jgi:hypothetical protein